MVKQFAGKLKEAQEIYLKILGINKFNIRAYYGLYMLDTNFINNDNGFEIELDKLNSTYDEGLRFIKGARINDEFIFFGIYQNINISNGNKEFNLFEYSPNRN